MCPTCGLNIPDAALETVGGSEETLREMIPPFIDETSELLSALSNAIEHNHLAVIVRLGQMIKGTEFSFSVEPTAPAAAWRLEGMERNDSLTGAHEAGEILEREIERLSDILMDFAIN